MMKNCSLSRLLRGLLAMTLALAMLLCCGCGPKEPTEPDPKDDGKLEAQDVIDGFTSVYGTVLSSMGGQTDTSSRSEVDMTVTLGDDLLATLGNMLQAEGLPGDASWLRQIGLKMDTTQTEALTKVVMDLRLGQTELLSAEYIMETASAMVYAALPGLNDRYLGIAAAPEGMDVAADTVDIAALIAALPTEQALNTLLTRYLNVLLEHLPEPVESSEILTCNGISQELTATTHTIRRSQALDMAEAILTTAQTDVELEKMLDDYAAYYNAQMEAQYAEYSEMFGTPLVWENVDMHQEMLDAIEEALVDLAEVRVDLEDGDCLVLSVYSDEDGQLGLSLKAIEDTEAVEINAYSLRQKDNTALLVEVKDMFRFSGTGTRSDGLASGYYTLSVMDTEMAGIEVRNFDVEAMEQGNLKGELELHLSQTMIDEVFGYDSFVTTDTRLVMKLDMQGEVGTATYELYEGDTFLLRLTGTAKSVETEKVSVPADYVDMYDRNAYDVWVARFDWEELRQRLRQAGVPEEVADLLQENLFGG